MQARARLFSELPALGYKAKYVTPRGHYETADAIGDVIGDLDSGYEADLMASAVRTYHKNHTRHSH